MACSLHVGQRYLVLVPMAGVSRDNASTSLYIQITRAALRRPEVYRTPDTLIAAKPQSRASDSTKAKKRLLVSPGSSCVLVGEQCSVFKDYLRSVLG